VVYEPPSFGDERLALFGDGRIQALKIAEVHKLLGVQERQ
jgi:hypothetical protein